MNDGYVKHAVADGIATVTFHHPKSNSLPGHVLRDLADAITRMGADPAVRVIVLRSDGETRPSAPGPASMSCSPSIRPPRGWPSSAGSRS